MQMHYSVKASQIQFPESFARQNALEQDLA